MRALAMRLGLQPVIIGENAQPVDIVDE